MTPLNPQVSSTCSNWVGSFKFQASVASYIESYNTQRPHRTLKNLTPCQVEENSIEKAE